MHQGSLMVGKWKGTGELGALGNAERTSPRCGLQVRLSPLAVTGVPPSLLKVQILCPIPDGIRISKEEDFWRGSKNLYF